MNDLPFADPPEPEQPPWAFEEVVLAGIPGKDGSRPDTEPGEGSRPRYILRDAAFAMQPQPPVDWVIEPLIAAGSVSLIVGNPGAKKTRALLSAAVRVALGGKWLSFDTKKCRVLFIDEESGERRFARWLGDALRGEFGDEETEVNFISLARLNLFKNEGDALLLQALITDIGAQLVIIDALADIMPGGDENAVKDVHPVFMRLRKIAEETQAAIVVIHHSNRAGDYRGSSAMSGAVDLLIMVESKNGSPIIEFTSKKARDTEPIRFSAIIHFEDGRTWLSNIDPAQAIQRKAGEAYVLKILKERGPMALPDIEANADTCSSATARDAVYSLAREGIVYRTNPGAKGRGVTAIYAIRENYTNEPAK